MIEKLVFVLSIISVINCEMPMLKLVIDNDAGGDDAMAIFLALLNEKYFNGTEVVALTTVNGNTNEDNVYVNNQKILKVANRQDIPIYRGSKSSIVRTPEAGAFYGVDGLGDTNDIYEGLVPAQPQGAVAALIQLSKTYEGNLNVITLGSVTNVALAIKLDPYFLGRLNHLYVAAGHLHNSETPYPEFNAQMDVEAYHIIAQAASHEKVTIVPFSQIRESLNFTKEWRMDVLGNINTDIMRAQNKFEKVAFAKEERWQALDPAAVAIAIKPDLVEQYTFSKNDIITCGNKRGMNTNELVVDRTDSNVGVIYYVKEAEYKQFLLDVFSAELPQNHEVSSDDEED